MADPEFETRLGRLYAEAPAFPDADGFARRIEGRIARAWTVRRLLIGAAGIGGGVVAAGQMLGGHLFQAATGISTAAADAVQRSGRAVGQLGVLTELPIGSEVMWVGLGLAVLAVVLMAARSLEEF
ncbi:MAG TPA: hypothetical protein VIJ94_20560 [Caulobacteraceae bacterium]